ISKPALSKAQKAARAKAAKDKTAADCAAAAAEHAAANAGTVAAAAALRQPPLPVWPKAVPMAPRPHCLRCSKRLAANLGLKCHCAGPNAACGYCFQLHKKCLEIPAAYLPQYCRLVLLAHRAFIKPNRQDIEKLANYYASYTSLVEAYIRRIPQDPKSKVLLELQKLNFAVRKLVDVLTFNISPLFLFLSCDAPAVADTV
ncbi:MAG: hypothetical protein M1829_002906, partial [Trizodia sp. TS-e1964]